MKKTIALLLCLCLAAGLTACKTVTGEQSDTGVTAQNAAATEKTESPGAAADESVYDLDFTKKDTDGAFDAAEAARIVFENGGASVTGDGVSAEGSLVTVTAAGTYIFSGETADGRIHVSAGESVLNGLKLTSSTAAITAESADKVIITLADGTENTLADAQSYTLTVGGSDVDGAIFAKTDLTVNGGGTLTVNGNKKHGIVTKDSLALTGGTVNVTAANVGLLGKDCVKAKDVSLTVSAGTDAIRSDNSEKSDRGYVYFASGVYELIAGSDGVQAETLLRVDGGEISVVSGGGSANSTKGQQGRDAFAGFYQQNNTSEGYTESESSKGLKSSGSISVYGGSLALDCADDAIHADGDIRVAAGLLTISSGDDAIHADRSLTIDDGLITVEKSYEGLEAADITVNGGTVTAVASDDGVNVSGGNDSGAGYDRFSGEAVTDGAFTVNGGYVYINAGGDGLDSNGNLSITGGTVLVSGPENGANGAVDYAGTGTITGGVLIAAGASGMAQGLTGSGAGCILVNIDTQQGGTSVALTDENGGLVAGFTPEKSYSSVVIGAPGIGSGKTYSVVAGGSVADADENGFAAGGTLTGGTTLKTVQMTSETYSEGGFGGMGGRGGPGGQMPDGQTPGGNGNMPTPPDGNMPSMPADGNMPSPPDGNMPSMPDGVQPPNMPDGSEFTMPADGSMPTMPDGSSFTMPSDGSMPTPPNGL